jgi:dTDP-4-dehydrorhamnose reductase
MMRVLVLGAYGLLGASLCPRLESRGWQVARQGRRDGAEFRFDPGGADAVVAGLEAVRPDVVVNLAACTNVDACEADPGMAYESNVRTVEAVTAAVQRIRDRRIHLVQISTDQIYNGTGPHVESGSRPCNVYALSKLAGEFVARRVPATVLRVNFFGRSRALGRTSLSDWLVASLRARAAVTVFEDVLFSPLHLETLSEHVAMVCERRLEGTFNVAAADAMSKARFAQCLAELLNLDTSGMVVGKSSSAGRQARRPQDMQMDVTAFQEAFGVKMPTVHSQLDIAAREYAK